MAITPKPRLYGIQNSKFLLILGVVLIHCNFSVNFPNEIASSNNGLRIINWISSGVCKPCVPVFFILSGYLFFYNLTGFSFEQYQHKLKKRVRSLFIPYIFWCVFCAFLLFVKFKYLHMSGLGIWNNDGSIDWQNFIKGFWSIDATEDMPYALAFWFIRNLMVFSILAPLAWIICRSYILFIIMWAYLLCANGILYGFEWFVLGAFLAYHKKDSGFLSSRVVIFVSFVFWLTSLTFWESIHFISLLASYIQVICALLLVRHFGLKIESYIHSRIINQFVSATFFIYAFHQCFCTQVRLWWVNLFGIENFACTISAYFCSFITMVLICVITKSILHRFTPRFLAIITGSR